jgi:hypothetical protein
MNQYGKAALKAVELYTNGDEQDLVQAWQQAIAEFTDSLTSQNKGCPRDTFLGLCEEGCLVPFIPRGQYTNSEDNKAYGLRALAALRQNPSLAASTTALWNNIERSAKNEQGQMGVVIALWQNELIR